MLKTESIYHDEKSGPNFGKMAHEHLNVFRVFTCSLMPILIDKLHQSLVGYVVETFFACRPHVLKADIYLSIEFCVEEVQISNL